MGIQGVPLDKSQIIQALHKNKGIIMHASKELACDPRAIYGWMERDEEVKKAVDDARANAEQERRDLNQILVAKAYKSAEKLLDRNDVTMTIFTMKTLGGLEQAPAKVDQVKVRGQTDNVADGRSDDSL